MKMITKVLLTAAALVALAAPAMAANDKLIVKDSAGSAEVFKVQDDGSIIGGKIKFDATGTTTPDRKFLFGLGTTSPTDPFSLQHVWSTPGIGTQTIFVAGSINDVARFTMRRANGTAGSFTALTANQQIGNFNFRGHDGSNFSAAGLAAITSNAEEAFTSTAQGTRMAFMTTPIGSVIAQERIRLSGNGDVVLGNVGGAATGPLAVSATAGFIYIPTVAGAVTSCATIGSQFNGHAPLWFDTTNNKVCTCNGATLKCTAALL